LIVASIIVVFADEVVKERYVFKISDLFVGGVSHEKIIVALVMALATSILVGWRRRGKNETVADATK